MSSITLINGLKLKVKQKYDVVQKEKSKSGGLQQVLLLLG